MVGPSYDGLYPPSTSTLSHPHVPTPLESCLISSHMSLTPNVGWVENICLNTDTD